MLLLIHLATVQCSAFTPTRRFSKSCYFNCWQTPCVIQLEFMMYVCMPPKVFLYFLELCGPNWPTFNNKDFYWFIFSLITCYYFVFYVQGFVETIGCMYPNVLSIKGTNG